MRWKQFFAPVQSINADQGGQLIADSTVEELIMLDVRQPEEYKAGHLSGATLIPLAELSARLDELPPHKTILVY